MPRPHPALLVLRGAALIALGLTLATAIEYFGGGGDFCAPRGECARVQLASGIIGTFLPLVGSVAFATLFVASLVKSPLMSKITAALAVVGGLGALGLIGWQAFEIGHYCWLCLTVDTSAIIAAGAGVVLLVKRPPSDELGEGLVSYWWSGFWVVVFLPFLWIVTSPDHPIPEPVRALYDDDAVNIVEMADFECPYCRAMNPILEEAIESSDREVHLVRVMVPLSFHLLARDASAAYYCAERDGQHEAMASALFANEDLSRDGLIETATSLGLEPEPFTACLDEESIDARIEEDLALADAAQNRGLPTVYIGERTFIGFDEANASVDYADAIAAAGRGEGGRINLIPLAAMLLFAFGSALIVFLVRRQQRRA